jgi:hypothetical protein
MRRLLAGAIVVTALAAGACARPVMDEPAASVATATAVGAESSPVAPVGTMVTGDVPAVIDGSLPGGRVAVDGPGGRLVVAATTDAALPPGARVRVRATVSHLIPLASGVPVARVTPPAPTGGLVPRPEQYAVTIGRVQTVPSVGGLAVSAPGGSIVVPVPADGFRVGDLVQVWTWISAAGAAPGARRPGATS